MNEKLRTVIFRPYRKGMGPVFCLRTFDTGETDRYGKARIAYRLSSKGKVIFAGNDFCCSPLYCIDSDECVAALMGFLTLRPGDTDRDYFDSYTPDQLAFAEHHGEALQIEVMHRFERGGQ